MNRLIQDDVVTEVEGIDITSNDWSEPPKVSDLKKDIDQAKTDHDTQISLINAWAEILDPKPFGYDKNKRGRQGANRGRSSIQIKLARKQAEWRYAALSEPMLSTDEMFDIQPVTFEDVESAEQNGLILNKQFRVDINKVRFVNEFVRTAVDEGTVIVRTGWANVEKPIKRKNPVFSYGAPESKEEADLLTQLIEEVRGNPAIKSELTPSMLESVEISTQRESLVWASDTGEFEEVDDVLVLVNRPTVEVVPTKNIIIDPTCGSDYESAAFFAHLFETSLGELEAAGIYDNLDKITLTPAESDTEYTRQNNSEFAFRDNTRKKIVACEYWGLWDINGDGELVPIVATWVGNTMIRLQRNPFPDQKPPFVVVPYLPVAGSVYGEPDAALLEDNQKVISAVTRGMIDIMGKSANGQTGMRKGALSYQDMLKYRSGEDYEFQGSGDPDKNIYQHKYPEIPQSAEFMLNMMNAEAEALTGIKSFSSGINSQALGNVATGIRSAMDATAKRELDILRRLSKGLEDIGRKIIAMNGVWLNDEEVIRITNNSFIKIKRDDLVGKIDLRVAISTPESDAQKSDDLSFLLQTTAQSFGPEMSQIILSEIAKLKKLPQLANSIKNFKPTVDPLQQHKMELEVKLLEAQLENERAQAFQRGASGQLDQAKIGTEEAKAGNLDSDSNVKDLEFLEKSTGTTQAQELQKMETEAESKKQLEQLRLQNQEQKGGETASKSANLTKSSTDESTTVYNGVDAV